MTVVAREGPGARPRAVTLAGWALTIDGVAGLLLAGVTLAIADEVPVAGRFAAVVMICGISALEIWIGRGLLRRRRWLGGVLFPSVFLALAVLIPGLPGEPPPPLYSVVYSTTANAIYALIIVTLVWHRSWFSGSDKRIQDRLQHVD